MVINDHEIELKDLSLKERENCNNADTEINPVRETIITHEPFSLLIRWLRYGLKKLNGTEITEDNFDNEINKLSTPDIRAISNAISEKANAGQTLKKKS